MYKKHTVTKTTCQTQLYTTPYTHTHTELKKVKIQKTRAISSKPQPTHTHTKIMYTHRSTLSQYSQVPNKPVHAIKHLYTQFNKQNPKISNKINKNTQTTSKHTIKPIKHYKHKQYTYITQKHKPKLIKTHKSSQK